MKGTLLKVAKVALPLLGIGVTLATNVMNKKEETEKINKAVQKALAEQSKTES